MQKKKTHPITPFCGFRGLVSKQFMKNINTMVPAYLKKKTICYFRSKTYRFFYYYLVADFVLLHTKSHCDPV